MNNLTKEQVFQLKITAANLAVQAGTPPADLIVKAQEIYDFLTAELNKAE